MLLSEQKVISFMAFLLITGVLNISLNVISLMFFLLLWGNINLLDCIQFCVDYFLRLWSKFTKNKSSRKPLIHLSGRINPPQSQEKGLYLLFFNKNAINYFSIWIKKSMENKQNCPCKISLHKFSSLWNEDFNRAGYSTESKKLNFFRGM